MLTWIVAVGAALALSAFLYFRERRNATTGAAFALRVLALTFAAALLLDAPRGRTSTRAPLVAIDASASWLRGRDSSEWQRALAAARSAARGDTVWLAGDSVRPLASRDALPVDNASRTEALVDRAAAAGRPLVLFTDGELDDPRALERVLGGSRVQVAGRSTAPDAAVLGLEVPRSAVAGDTIEVVVRVAAGAAGAGAGTVTLMLERAPVLRLALDSLGPGAERDVRANIRIPVEGGEHRLVRAALSVPGDVVPRNDTLAAAFDVAAVPSGVFVSTAPDQDSRFALDVLRGTLAIAVRAYYRVAPNVWRQEPGFTPVTEAEVRAAFSQAPLAVLHGDTTMFGQPRRIATGALALIAPASPQASDDWYAVAAPTSPLSGAYAGLPWDSLPPVATSASLDGEWQGLVVRRPRTTRDDRVVVAGREDPRRTVVVAGSGFWRWRFRGGASADAFAALWGGIFDWLVAGGDDRRAAVPAAAWVRGGEPVSWRRGARRDSLVVAVLRSIDGVRVDSVTLRFPGDATLAESPPLPVGEYEISVPGGRSRLVVAASREWLPRAPTVAAGEIGAGQPRGFAPRLRDAWWAYVLVLVALCAEWFVRRGTGLR